MNIVNTAKTAITVNRGLLQEVDRIAREMGVSRSRLFSAAVEEYLRHVRQHAMIEQLNRVYGDHPDPAEQQMASNMKAKMRPVIKDRW